MDSVDMVDLIVAGKKPMNLEKEPEAEADGEDPAVFNNPLFDGSKNASSEAIPIPAGIVREAVRRISVHSSENADNGARLGPAVFYFLVGCCLF